MMNFIAKMIFFLTMICGSIITFSSSSWLGMWMGLEINLMSFIPLMINNNNILSTEAAIKYFLTQIFASLFFLFMSISFMVKFNFLFNFNELNYENLIINMSMMLKLGAAPLHFWFPNIIDGLSWTNCLIILTWQKLTPLTIISYCQKINILFIFILMSCIIGAIGGLNQLTLRKILAFSSINHISWILLSFMFNNILWIYYFLIYFLINFSIINLFKMFNLFNINQIFLFNKKFPLMKFCFLMNFLSLGGLPPFIGFLPKWMVIENLILTKNLFILLFVIMMTLITLFFYIRITFSSFLMFYPSFSWKIFYFIDNKNMTMNLIMNFLMMLSLSLFLLNSAYLT